MGVFVYLLKPKKGSLEEKSYSYVTYARKKKDADLHLEKTGLLDNDWEKWNYFEIPLKDFFYILTPFNKLK